jgi:thiol-disulfide isomerase/thioredoxin
MKIIKTLLALMFISSAVLYAQEVKPLKSTQELDELRNSLRGKVVLINFWATWCKPCVKEFPELVKLYNDYKDKNFRLIFISADVPEEIENKVTPFLKSQNVEFITYYNNFDKPEELINYIDKNWEGAIPSTYIYDKDGNLTSNILGMKNYEYFEKEITKNMN